jgi:aminoglycoside phosphotransferase (APT) family kinase protein
MELFGLTALEGGFSGETFVADGAGERTVVRIYGHRGARRGPRAVEVDAAVLRLVRGLLPVPEVLEVRLPDPEAQTPALLVTGFLPGTRLDLALPGLAAPGRERVGRNLGLLLSRLAQMPMPAPGVFVDPSLRVEPLPAGGLRVFVESQRTGTAIEHWPQQEYDGLLAVADHAQDLLDAIDRTTLVHSDLNPKNVLVDPDSLEVTGLLDWEFAHAGCPVADLGNLLRFEREPVFAGAVLDTYVRQVPDATGDVLERARAADLFALVDLAGRLDENPVARRADALLRAVARTGDLSVVP